MIAWRAEAGFSLAELLASTALMSVLMAATLTVLVAGEGSHGLRAARLGAHQAARIALERMTRELREAGYDPTGIGLRAVVVAEPTRVAFQRDLNGNGVLDPTRERVTYLLRGSVLRREAGAGAQPIIEGVRSLALPYFDRAGEGTTDPYRAAGGRRRP